jgi:tetratricopeptide (TPR) repeat protein
MSKLRVLAALVATAALGAQEAPVLEKGVGNVHYAVSTNSANAQKFFDQGMAYLYGFNHEAAIRSFKKASELDPDMAMAYWGIALALGPNINLDVDPDREKEAYEAVQTALKHEANASPKERDMIAALAKRYSNDPQSDLKRLSSDYSSAMGTLTKKYPDDLDLATLYGESMMDLRPWKFWSHEGKPAPQTEDIVAVLESVLQRNPKHLGANHYYIHAVEASSHPERALKSADRLNTLAPASGHLVHMPAHIYQRTGNYSGAARANENAAATDREFIKKNGQGMYAMMYYNHNLQFGSASHAMEGRFADAKRMADEFGANAAAMTKDLPPLEGFAASPLLVLVRFGKWTDVVRAPMATAGPLSTTLSHFARGVAFAKLGDIPAAEREREEFEASRKALTDDPGFLQNSPKNIASVAGGVLDGRIAEAKGDRQKALQAYRRAVEVEDTLDYDEPPDWFYPARETLGAALLRMGQSAEAEKVFRADLDRNPNNPRSLFGLAEARKAQKKSAASALAQFRRAWRGGALRVEDL